MRPFEYVRPGSVPEAASFLAEKADDALAIGGGTAAVVLMHLGVLRPSYVVDLSGLDELRGVREEDGVLRVGALTTLRSLELGGYGLLSDAASQVANVRVRNVATVGGSIAYGEPQSDTPVALIAAGASVTIAGPTASRELPLSEFFMGPFETALAQGEIVSAVSVPAAPKGSGGCHMKFTIGSPENKPVANASAYLHVDASGKCVEARVVMGAVGPVPVVAAAAGRLVGETPTEELIDDVAAEAAEETDPVDDLRGPVWHKRRVTKVLVGKALRCALQRATA